MNEYVYELQFTYDSAITTPDISPAVSISIELQIEYEQYPTLRRDNSDVLRRYDTV